MKKSIFLMNRPLQWSHLTSGLPIPEVFHQLTYNIIGRELNVEEHVDVRIMFDGEIFNTSIYNIGFDRTKFNHKDILQFKYDNNKPLLAKLQQVFYREYQYCLEDRSNKQKGDRRRTKISEKYATKIEVYGTEEPGLFIWEPQFEDVNIASKDDICRMSEEEFEILVSRTDPNARIKHIPRLQKVRELDASIGDSLKRVYGYRCQMTGEMIGETYGTEVIEAHHIVPFTKSLNNDMSNIMILSPNYHRIIHKAKPLFNRKELSFEFPNGLIEKIKVNYHLKPSLSKKLQTND